MASAVKLGPEQSTGKSADLVMSARVEFYACLQLLAERARFVTGASWAAIAVREGEQFVYRAASGPGSPEIGNETHISAEKLTASEADFRPGKCLAVPVLRGAQPEGFFELTSDRFEFAEHDFKCVLRLSAMVGTALDHLDAAEHTQELVCSKTKHLAENSQPAKDVNEEAQPEKLQAKAEIPLLWHAREGVGQGTSGAVTSGNDAANPNVHTCDSCGFPVSDGRNICVDCEGRIGTVPHHSGLLSPEKPQSWIREHGYTIATLLVPLVAAAVIYWLR